MSSCVTFPQFTWARHGALAQLAEQRTFNPRVQGSIPWGPTTLHLEQRPPNPGGALPWWDPDGTRVGPLRFLRRRSARCRPGADRASLSTNAAASWATSGRTRVYVPAVNTTCPSIARIVFRHTPPPKRTRPAPAADHAAAPTAVRSPAFRNTRLSRSGAGQPAFIRADTRSGSARPVPGCPLWRPSSGGRPRRGGRSARAARHFLFPHHFSGTPRCTGYRENRIFCATVYEVAVVAPVEPRVPGRSPQ